MSISTFEIFKIGIGPSSSHTLGPMKAAKAFIDEIQKQKKLKIIKKISCELYGSLAMTGKGHGTDKAILLGLEGYSADTINSDIIPSIISRIKNSGKINLSKAEKSGHEIDFNFKEDLKFQRKITLPKHPNGMAIAAYDEKNKEILRQIYYSIGGGFIVLDEDFEEIKANDKASISSVPYHFNSAKELLEICEKKKFTIPKLMMENEKTWRKEKEIRDGILNFYIAMKNCIDRGLKNEGTLPGGLKVKRRAPTLHKQLMSKAERHLIDPLTIIDWINLYALAVNEENAAGGQVVTAPTNGAAGIIPAVLMYYKNFTPNPTDDGIIDFFLTAAAIAILYKKNASISGAEVGCQGEVGVACSMAAGALTQVLGGSIHQVENAAEIGMEHNLGLTCDPIGGLVQIPCIERNAIGSMKAINASRLALQGDGVHFVSLDKVIKTMNQTGKDMKEQYKETSRGGLAVNLPEC